MQPESRITNAIRKYCEAQGAFVFKVHGSETMMAGLPDLIVCHEGRFLGIEVKTPEGTVSLRQTYVHTKIHSAGGTAIVARKVEDVKWWFE
jgi:Holliday junction resolvase